MIGTGGVVVAGATTTPPAVLPSPGTAASSRPPQAGLQPHVWHNAPVLGSRVDRSHCPRGRGAVALAGAVLVLGACAGPPEALPPEGDGLGLTADPTPAPTPGPTGADPTSPAGGSDLSVEQVAAQWGSSVYRVEADGCGYTSTGSGWVLDDQHVVTNRHVVLSDPQPDLVGRDGAQLAGTVVGWAESPDIAVIRVDDGDLNPPLQWAPAAELNEGQQLVSIGYPAPAGDFSVIATSIISFQTLDSARQAIRADGALDRGNSGGPALTRDGRVAGVVTEMAQNPDGLQLVPLIYTADAVQATVDGILAQPGEVEATCDTSREVVPDTWSGDAAPPAEPESGAQAYGEDPDLDLLYDACAEGDMDACDDLYWSSPYGSEYEAFGASCGGTGTAAYGYCSREGDAADPSSDLLDQLDAECADGDLASCDTLYWRSGLGSEQEDWASTCGERTDVEHAGSCRYADEVGDGIDVAVEPDLELLREECVGGDLVTCDELYWNSPLGSEDEELGGTCGGRQEISSFGRCRTGAP